MIDMDTEERTTEVRTDNVPDTDRSVRRETVRSSAVTDGGVVAARVVWYIAGFIIVILALRFLLFALGANRDSGFVDFIYSISSVFVAPFQNIFPAPVYGQFFFDTASLVAMLIYGLIAWGIARLFTLNSRRTDV
jgi:hypothetical protein